MCFEKTAALSKVHHLANVGKHIGMHGLNASSHLFLPFGRTLSSVCMPTVSLVGKVLVIEEKAGRRMLTPLLAFPT